MYSEFQVVGLVSYFLVAELVSVHPYSSGLGSAHMAAFLLGAISGNDAVSWPAQERSYYGAAVWT